MEAIINFLFLLIPIEIQKYVIVNLRLHFLFWQILDFRIIEMAQHTITIGGGCFWCTEAVFEEVEGIIDVVSGYSGGTIYSPTYEDVCTGLTGHAEVIQITYDDEKISLEEILEIFFATHDPTTLNRQGFDIGTQYRSVIFYTNEEEKEIAEKVIKKFEEDKIFENKIVTEISLLKDFYMAEEHHQDFYKKNPNYGYCSAVINPKLMKLREKYKAKLKVVS